MGGGSTLYYPGANSVIGALRSYFQLNGITAGNPATGSGVKAFVLNFGEDNATSIQNHNLNVNLNDGEWYDLDGRKLSGKPSQKGIYINNGRKVLK